MRRKNLLAIITLLLALVLSLSACHKHTQGITEDGEYTSKTEVAEYINTYHHLPDNYVTKKEARNLGWYGGNPYDEIGKYIGGSYFGNRERKLPKDRYYECDVDYRDDTRGARRLVYTNEGTVYYTEDHYESFEQLY